MVLAEPSAPRLVPVKVSSARLEVDGTEGTLKKCTEDITKTYYGDSIP